MDLIVAEFSIVQLDSSYRSNEINQVIGREHIAPTRGREVLARIGSGHRTTLRFRPAYRTSSWLDIEHTERLDCADALFGILVQKGL